MNYLESKMEFEALKDFELYSKVSEDIIVKYEGKIPEQFINIWKKYGFGQFFQGYFKLVNPDNYIEFVRKSYFEKNCIPLLVTAFGDIVIWEKNEYLSLLTYRYRNFDCLEYGCEFLFNDLSDNEYVERHFKNRIFYKALEKLDIPSYDECFGYVPLLSLGGSEKPENLHNVKLREHLELMYQMQGCI